MKQYCCGFLFHPTYNEVLLIEKRRPEWQRGLLNGVGGHVEDGEAPYVAMVREFKEEVGVEVVNWMLVRTERYGHNSDNPEGTKQRVNVHFFAAVASVAQWDACRQMTDEAIMRVRVFPAPLSWKSCIYNLEYLVPMARVLLRQPAQNIPLP